MCLKMETEKLNHIVWLSIGVIVLAYFLSMGSAYIVYEYGFKISCFIHKRDCSWTDMTSSDKGNKSVINTELGTYVKYRETEEAKGKFRVVYSVGGIYRYQLKDYIEELKSEGYVLEEQR